MFEDPYLGDMTPTAAIELAEAVVENGFAAHQATLAALLADARRHGVSEALVVAASDAAEPQPVRERALGMLVVRYVRLYEAGPDSRVDRAADRTGDRAGHCIAA